MNNALKACIVCATLSEQNRCPDHRRQFEQDRASPTERGYDAGWRPPSKAVIKEHVAVHGWVCPGYGRAAFRRVRCPHR